MNHRDAQILQKIIREIDIALEMVHGNVTVETRLSNQQVPWKAAAGFRDIAAHKYQTLKMEDVYQTVTEDFIELRKLLTAILSQ